MEVAMNKETGVIASVIFGFILFSALNFLLKNNEKHKFLKKYKDYLIGIIITIILIFFIPMVVEYILIINVNTSIGQIWIQFFGGYIGAIIGFFGVIVTIYFSYKQFVNQQEEYNFPYITLALANKSEFPISFIEGHITWSIPDDTRTVDDLIVFIVSSIDFINSSTTLITDLKVEDISFTDSAEKSVNTIGYFGLIDHPTYPLEFFELKFIPPQMKIGMKIKFEHLPYKRVPRFVTESIGYERYEFNTGYFNVTLTYKNRLNKLFKQEFKIQYKAIFVNKQMKIVYDLSNSRVGYPVVQS